MRFIEGHDYSVYRQSQLIGNIIGDEFIRSSTNQLLYRIDGEEIYTVGVSSQYVGEMDGLTGRDTSGNAIFHLELD
ncbi:hypothetical protein Q8W40_24805 [Vibrio penaeicida]|uniref:hypothetical protein n=1 Tax=Vibrio penaeicida TaxID=104609 RepID=UPI0027334F09|nr:hypothetical protein [Vibrio penaeicida]MDP2575438.1 hypothetical protein [Vibrio penaeicida]